MKMRDSFKLMAVSFLTHIEVQAKKNAQLNNAMQRRRKLKLMANSSALNDSFRLL